MSLASFHGCFEGHDVVLKVHDWALDFASGSSGDVEFVEEFDHSELGCSIGIDISDGNISFRLEVGHVEFKELGVES